MIEDVPDGWTEIETEFASQLQALQRRRDGLVLSIERGLLFTGRGRAYQMVTLPENFHEDNQVIDHLAESDDHLEVDAQAYKWMQENDRQ